MVVSQSDQHELSRGDNVGRHRRPRDFDDGILSSNAFLLRDGESYLSTNWLEHFHPSDRAIQVPAVCKSLTDKGRTVKFEDLLIVLNVGTATKRCKAKLGVGLSFVTLGELDDPSHTGIYGISANVAKVASELAASVKPDEIYSVRYPDAHPLN